MRGILALVLSMTLVVPDMLFAANHREAPITALDHKADITDFFAFRSYESGFSDRVTFILCVDPLLEPANGPNYFPFDPEILYEIKIDNNHNARPDIIFQFRFETEIRAPGVFTGFVGAGSGINAPSNSPSPVSPGTPIIPPAITSLDGSGSEGLSLRQKYSVTRLTKTGAGTQSALLGSGLIALPSNVGRRTMPSYDSLFDSAVYDLGNGIRVFAGTVDDPFWIDLGAAFDSLNFRDLPDGSSVPGVLTNEQDADDENNYAPDDVSGYNVNAIAIEIPISQLTSNGSEPAAGEPEAIIGAWGTTARPRVTVRRSPRPAVSSGQFRQVQRMGNPLFNELIIGTGSKDRFSMDKPHKDSQFASFALDPLLARVLNAVYEALIGPGTLPIPAPDRLDLLPLVQYDAFYNLLDALAGIGGGSPTPPPAGPVADVLRLNVGVGPTPLYDAKRLGAFAHDVTGTPTPDFAAFPNGRRVLDDVTDIAARAVAGALEPIGNHDTGFDPIPGVHDRIGDGVNVNDRKYRGEFPYLAPAHSGRDSRHVDPGEVCADCKEGSSSGGDISCPDTGPTDPDFCECFLEFCENED